MNLTYLKKYLILVITFMLSGCGGGSDDKPVVNLPPVAPIPEQFTNKYQLFESGQVRPLAINHQRNELYALNTPDNRLEIYDIENNRLIHKQSLFSGLEPVALALKNQNELWVVNHLSDSISIVDLGTDRAKVINTLYVGDEPRDIIFAGPGNQYAFITTAHRGQHSDVVLYQTSSAIARADVWVFDASNTGEEIGGTPLQILNLFGDTPRPLAKSRDGSKVYVGIFNSGNQTTSLLATSNLDKASPRVSGDGVYEPDSSLIVKYKNGEWVDERGFDYSRLVRFNLPDYDVFELDTASSPFKVQKRYSQVGTTLFNMAVNPATGELLVSNTDSRNEVRFVGDNTSHTSLNGHYVINQLSLINDNGVTPIDLNPHIDKNTTRGTAAKRSLSISQPMQLQFLNEGTELLLTSFGSQKIVRIPMIELTENRYGPKADQQIQLTGGGPAGIVINEDETLAYVLTRFDNGISVIDLTTNSEIAHYQMYSPEPTNIIEGRKFLYDAALTSGHGNVSCGSCHIFGDMDHLAWDLGNPAGEVETINLPYQSNHETQAKKVFHPLKGPMMTQSMRGLKSHGPMHWRGDRTGKNRKTGESLERAAFKEFNEAFTMLMGRDAELSENQMELFADFAMELQYPPNPNRKLDNQLTASQQNGRQHYDSTCSSCHRLDPSRGIFGTLGLMAKPTPGSDQDVKIPHFRNLYQKIGMYGTPASAATNTGDQIKGFGFLHNGSLDLKGIFTVFSNVDGLEEFLMAYPSKHAPIVGQQVTINKQNLSVARNRLNLLTTRAMLNNGNGECDLIVTGAISNSDKAFYLLNNGNYMSDKSAEPEINESQLLALLASSDDYLTFSCLPLENGYRNALDRNFNDILNGDE